MLAWSGRLDILVVREQIGKISHQMDSSMWWTTNKVDFKYSSHTWLSSILSHVGNTARHCRLGLFQDSDFVGDLEDSKSSSGGVLCIFGSRTFVLVSWMCKKQTSVSHSSTESEILSLDAGLRMDGLLVLDLWDIVIEELRATKDNIQPRHISSGKLGQIQTQPCQLGETYVCSTQLDNLWFQMLPQ